LNVVCKSGGGFKYIPDVSVTEPTNADLIKAQLEVGFEAAETTRYYLLGEIPDGERPRPNGTGGHLYDLDLITSFENNPNYTDRGDCR
jgi:hypothetical protein